MSSFTKKELRVTIILATAGARFPGTESNTLIISGLRVVATVEQVARQSKTADIRIYGMLPADMNALTVVFFNPPAILDNIVVLEASEGDGWTQVFSGTIFEAQPEYRGMPNVFFRLFAYLGYKAKITPTSPVSYSGATQVATVCAQLAKAMGFAFENHGVTAVINTPYLPGTSYDQLQRICQASGTDFYFDNNAQAGQPGTLAIVPAGLGRDNIPATVVSPQSGLNGYPTLEYGGVTIDALYNRNFAGGGKVLVQGCDIPAANGSWMAYAITHTLESVNPNGRWSSVLHCAKYGFAMPDVSAS